MKKSKVITLGILALTAISCNENSDNTEVKHCVDNDGVVMDESVCNVSDDAGATSSFDENGNPIIIPRFGAPHVYYHWYYGGGYYHPLTPGTRIIVSPGGFRPSIGHVYSSPSTFSRGGFGTTGHSFSGGAGE